MLTSDKLFATNFLDMKRLVVLIFKTCMLSIAMAFFRMACSEFIDIRARDLAARFAIRIYRH